MISILTDCRRDESQHGESTSSTSIEKGRPKDVVVFPQELRADDPSLNDFVTLAMKACAAGDYEAFRKLWSSKDDPLARGEFDQGWEAVREIRVRALEKVGLDDSGKDVNQPRMAYALAVTVLLDQAHPAGKREPKRDVILMIDREQDEWRVSRAPKPMREWLKKKIDPGGHEDP